MADYIFEKSNVQHPGITIIQDGRTTPFPLVDFVQTCNDALELLRVKSEFYDFMSKGVFSNEKLSKLSELNDNYTDQHAEIFLKIRNLGGKVCILDKDFFMKQLQQIKSLRLNSREQLEKCQSLYNVFNGALQRCVDRNNETAKSLGIPLPNKIEQNHKK